MWKFNISHNWEEAIAECGQIEGHVFFTPELVKAWVQTYAPLRDIRPVTVTGESKDGNRLALPMVLWRRNWKNAFERWLVPVGYSDFDYHDALLLRPLPSYDGFWDELLSFLEANVDFDVMTTDGILNPGTPQDWKEGEICPRLELGDIPDDDALMRFFKTSLRGDIRRQMRRLGELGTVKLKEFHSWEEVPKATFETFMRHHSLRWPNAYKAPHLHENLMKYGLPSGRVHFSVLKAGETEVAWHLGFEHRGRFYYYMPAGHADFRKFSPVKVHLYLLVRRAVENGLDVFDHLRGEENYKDGWSNAYSSLSVKTLYSDNLSSKLKHDLNKLKRLITPPDYNALIFTYLRAAS